MIVAINGTKVQCTKNVIDLYYFKSLAKLNTMDSESQFSMREEFMGDSTKLIRDKFYDFFGRVTKNERLDLI